MRHVCHWRMDFATFLRPTGWPKKPIDSGTSWGRTATRKSFRVLLIIFESMDVLAPGCSQASCLHRCGLQRTSPDAGFSLAVSFVFWQSEKWVNKCEKCCTADTPTRKSCPHQVKAFQIVWEVLLWRFSFFTCFTFDFFGLLVMYCSYLSVVFVYSASC